MPVLFGDKRKDGKIRVWQQQFRIMDPELGKTREVVPEDYPEGYPFDAEKIPEVPQVGRGINPVLVFDPKTGGFAWEEETRDLTPEEQMDERIEHIEEALARIEEKLSTEA